jgi:hypothetical protein
MVQKPPFSDMSAAAGWHPDRPYNDLPRLPPALDLEPRAVLKQCVTARAALSDVGPRRPSMRGRRSSQGS